MIPGKQLIAWRYELRTLLAIFLTLKGNLFQHFCWSHDNIPMDKIKLKVSKITTSQYVALMLLSWLSIVICILATCFKCWTGTAINGVVRNQFEKECRPDENTCGILHFRQNSYKITASFCSRTDHEDCSHLCEPLKQKGMPCEVSAIIPN